MEKLPCKRTLLLLVFLSPCIATPQYIPRHRVDTPMRVARAGAIPYHDYAQPHSPSPQQQQQQTPHQHPRQFHPHVPLNNPNVITPANVNPNFNANAFSSRKGPFDSFIDRAKTWLPGSNGEVNSEPKMRDAHRLPNPPKYPLYDLPTIGMATPPPAPLMHPMAQIPTGNYNYNEESNQGSQGGPWSNLNNDLAGSASNHVANNRGPAHHGHGHGPGGHNRKKPLRGPRPKHPLRGLGPNPFRPNNKKRLHNHNGPEGRGPPPNRRQHGHHQRQRPRGPPVQNRPNRLRAPPQKEEGFEHPMASNINPVNSPALGRPLDYDEYMKRPSHSFTDDPWNFDPFAAQMNQGMNTYALKYNYDPLGMNNLDNKANSHLDPAKLSYPGDFYNRETSDSASSSQIGGWDRAPTGYNGYMNANSNQPPSAPAYDTTITNPLEGGRIGPLDPFSSGTDNINSFNLFQQGNIGNIGNNNNGHNGNPQLGPTATVDLEQLNPPAEDAKIEFTIDTSMDPQQQPIGNLNDNGKSDNMAGLSDNYSPYGPDQPEGAPIGPPFGNLGDSNSDALQPPASFSYSRTSDYGMRNRRNNMCQYGNPNCIRRQLKRNLIIPTNAPNMLYNPHVGPLQESPSILQQHHSHPQPQMHQQNLVMQQMPGTRQMNHYYPTITARELQQYRRQLNLRQMYLNNINNSNNNNLARSDNNAMIVMEGGGGSLGQPQGYPQQTQGGHGHSNNNNIVPRSDMPEGLQIFNELMKPNGNSNLLTHSAKADARNNLLKVLTQRK